MTISVSVEVPKLGPGQSIEEWRPLYEAAISTLDVKHALSILPCYIDRSSGDQEIAKIAAQETTLEKAFTVLEMFIDGPKTVLKSVNEFCDTKPSSDIQSLFFSIKKSGKQAGMSNLVIFTRFLGLVSRGAKFYESNESMITPNEQDTDLSETNMLKLYIKFKNEYTKRLRKEDTEGKEEVACPTSEEETIPSWAHEMQEEIIMLQSCVEQTKKSHTMIEWDDRGARLEKECVWMSDETAAEQQQQQYKLDTSDCNPSQVTELNELLVGFVDLFAINNRSPRECKGVEHEVPLSERRVCVDKVRRIPSKFLELVDNQVEEMVENGIIRESVSSYNANPLLVDKKGGEKRFVIDFRSLNKITVRDNYPIPHVDDIIEKTRGSKFYTELDLASGYWCVPILEEDRHKTAFSVPRGKFEFNRLPFGMNNSQATFQRMVDNIVKKAHQRGAFKD